MSRRLWFFAAVLAIAMALPAAASAHPRHLARVEGARHPGKHTKRHLIAVRHGHRIHWLTPTHGLAKTHLPPIRLSADAGLRPAIHLATDGFGPTSAPTVKGFGTCTYNMQATPDGMNMVQSYGSLYGDSLLCVGNNGGNVESNAFSPYPTCKNGAPQSLQTTSGNSPTEYATFTDGEWMLLCTVPDDNGSGGSQANGEPSAVYQVYQQGFTCQAAVGVGSDDNTPSVVTGKDSLEYSQTYTENGQSVTALTTSCVGQLPNSVTVDSSGPVFHLVSCTQYDPQNPGKNVRGLGETVTWADGQYQETCNVPAYQVSVVCTTTPCSTNVRADSTSDLAITETPTTPGTLTEGVDQGNPLSCSGSQYGNYPDLGPNWYSFSFTGSGSKQLTYDLFFLPFNPSNNVQICFGATVSFRANSDDGSSQPGTLPDGTSGQIGLLPTCDSISSSGPCVSRVVPINGDAPAEGTQVGVFIPQSYTGDPFIGRG